VKIVVTSDAHTDWETSGAVRFGDVSDAMFRSVEVVREERADVYAFTGDLCNPDDAGDVLRAAELVLAVDRELAKLGVFRIWMPGNHDVFEDGSGRTTLSWMRSLDDEDSILVAERPCVHKYLNVRFACFPFTVTSHPYDPVEHARRVASSTPADARTIVLGHLSIPGIQPGEEVKELARGRDVVLPLEEIAKIPGQVTVVNGHYHRAQTFEDKATGVLVHVPGSLVRLTHGEEEHKPSILVLEV